MPLLTVDTDFGQDVQLYFEDHGEGRPIVLIHGWPLDGSSWEYNKPALIDAGFRVITYDRRGFGKSSRAWGGYDYDTFAADLAKLLDHLDVKDATLVGFSMGGGEVARYLGTHGTERVAQAVFAGAVPPYLYKTDDNPDGGLDDATIEQFQAGVTTDRAAFLEGFIKNFFTAGDQTLASDSVQHVAFGVAAPASPKGTLDCITAFGKTDFRPDLAKISLPTLVIHGDSDAIVPLEVSGKRTAEAIPGAQLHVVEGGPHGFNVTHAAEFNETLLAFVKTAPASA
ncbi:MAG: alpha/beta hydrolase [Solirubrobacteraceae bacterium]|nr:alpha/beta hydrolase [Solirubrobacteraceae bacterium]